MNVTVGLAQIAPVLGDVAANLDLHLDAIQEARAQGAELLVFPELALTGYALGDRAHDVAIRAAADDPAFARLLAASREIDLVTSFVEADARHRRYITAVYLSGGRVVHRHRKVYLPTYGLFDEGRFFAWGDGVRAFDTRFGRCGLLICEDFWHASPPYLLWLDGADLLIHVSSSPGRGLTKAPQLESARWVEHINRAYASLFTSFVIYSNRVGYEDGLNYWGGAAIFDPDGNLLVRGPYHQEALIVQEIDLNQLQRSRIRLPLLRDERTALVMREMERIVGQSESTSK